jgi:hypothetical protein
MVTVLDPGEGVCADPVNGGAICTYCILLFQENKSFGASIIYIHPLM